MRITWNNQDNRFEAELTAGVLWTSDKDALMSAGFKCIGPPLWIWWTTLSSTLTKLKTNRPQSGLTITKQALERFTAISALEAANTAVKAQLASAKKALRKDQKYQAEIAVPQEHEIEHGRDFDYNKVPPRTAESYTPPVIPPPPTTVCYICQTPVYWNECQEPPTCLWCEFP